MEKFKSIYCRAKSIMSKEEDALALMKEVYSLAEKSNVADENAEAWMIKQTYILGCGKFRKKQAREAEIIELQEHEYTAQQGIHRDKTKELICETLTELPDLYHATLFAFYHDRYSVKEVAAVTGYSVGVVINRLNYIHKYLSKKLENYQEENKVKVQFSVEMVCEALSRWASENTLDEDGVVTPEKIDVEAVKEELLAYSVKKGLDKKQVLLVAGIVGGLVILALVAVLILGGKDKKDDVKNQQPPVENQVDEDKDEEQNVLDDTTEESEGETQQEDSQEEESETANDSEYILPNSDTVRLTRSDLQGLSKEELRLARNEIFARHGMIFGVADLDAYFATKSWYNPTVAYDEYYDKVEMNSYEEANLVLISQVEEEMQ